MWFVCEAITRRQRILSGARVIMLLYDTSAAAYCACSVSMVWNRMVWTMYVFKMEQQSSLQNLTQIQVAAGGIQVHVDLPNLRQTLD